MKDSATITMGEGVISMRRKGSSAVTVASILGQVESGNERLFYLDRLIHKPHEVELDQFKVHGAKSTILVQVMPR